MTNAVRAAASRRTLDPWLNIVRGGWLAAALLPDSLSTSGTSLVAAVIVWTAWASVALGLLDEHLSHCVTGAMAAGGDEADRKLAEASAAIARLVRS